ncbi:RHS repeat-associated core domain-containing protein [Pseudomonas oryziphila]|uniref:RHS repeat-associated core domain-containing protein n=1 Tax=Pseudomonas oryziphila TaxID=2894079 RepID=UPI001CC1D9F4|nr:RHS repeat-associated core domain-containing protein [Pseudomonas oryziphila]
MSGETRQRESQVAVAPLNTIDAKDVGRGAAAFDAWLQSVSAGYVTLERIKSVAGALPVVGNIMALVDALGDVVTLVKSKNRQLLDWVSLGINLIGVLPTPPTMAAARMSLRPTLFLVRQELRNSAKMLLGDSLITVLSGHLNATIAGTIDDFVKQAQPKIAEILADAGALGTKVTGEIADGLEKVVLGQLDAKGDKAAVSRQMAAASDQLLYDPKTAISNFFGAVHSAYKAAGKGLANSATSKLLPDEIKTKVLANTGQLRALGPETTQQLNKLADPGTQMSIGWMLNVLDGAVKGFRKRNRNGQPGVVKPDTVTQVEREQSKGQLAVSGRQAPAEQTPSPKRPPCPPEPKARTGHSISFSLGSEFILHTDFSLPGPFPIEWQRTYHSRLAEYDQGSLGARWVTEFTTRIDVVGKGLVFHDHDARSHAFDLPKVGKALFNAIEDLLLVRSSEEELVICRGFVRKEYYLRVGDRYYLRKILLGNDAGCMLHYEHRHEGRPVLSDIITFQGDAQDVLRHLGTLIDDHGHITGLWEMRDGQPLRQLCAYHYDDQGDLVAAQDENGAAWHYQYQHHLVTRYTDRTGRGMNLEWDGSSAHAKAIHEWADDGSFDTRLEWDENIRLTYVTDAHGQETWYYYDIQGHLYRIRYPDERSEWLFRDDRKKLVRHVHPDGSEDRYDYDDQGSVIRHIRADHSKVHIAYDDRRHPIKIRDAEGGLWLRDYDLKGNLIEATDPLGNRTEYTYTPSGLIKAIKDAAGNEKKLAYNAADQLVEFTDCSGKTSQWAYDDLGRLALFTDAAGSKTAYEYNAGQLAKVIHPDNTEERFERDAEGRLLAHADALDRCTTWSYNTAGLLAERVDAAEHTVRYRWDKLGRLIGLENENESKATFLHDPVGRLLEEKGFDGLVTRYRYDPDSGRLASTQVGQRRIDITFDAVGRLASRVASLGDQRQEETFAYDGNGKLVQAVNADSKLQWFFDEAGNLTREHQYYFKTDVPMVAVWQHAYDALNHRVSTIRPDGHKVSVLTYGSGHVLGMTLDQHELLAYERDDLHREVVRHQGNQLMQTQAWDPAGRLQEQLLGSHDGKSTMLKRQYRYDAVGQLTDIHDTRRGHLAYQYDPVGRLLQATSRLGVETFAFDPAGNLLDDNAQQLNRPLERDPRRNKRMDNLLREYAGTHYQYDERGNLVHRLHNGDKARLTWDLFDRLTRFDDSKLSVVYSYDALGRRLHKHSSARYQDDPRSGSGWNRMQRAKRQRELGCGYTLYGWDGDTLAWESSPPQDEGETGRTVHYLYEPGSFVPVVQAQRNTPIRLLRQPDWCGREYDFDQDPLWHTEVKAQPFEAIAWYQCDHLGTPMELTDHNGEVAWAGQYKAWGEVREARSEWARQIGLSNPIRFQGQYHDHETGLHYNRYRYYDPKAGRFINQDPISYFGGLNLFAYTPNPIDWIDPLGLAKRGPKTNGEGPHNQVIAAWGREVQASGGTVIAGGGVLSERKIFTPGGHKNGRRPDIIYVDENGKRVYGNVGKVKADGETPIAREQKAMEDLRTKASQEDASDEVQFRAYNKPCP